MTDHPLTETAAAERWNAEARLIPWDDWGPVGRAAILAAFRDMHDAGREHERAHPLDDRPWEPLDGPVRVGDEVRRELNGITATAVVGRVDDDGDPWAAKGGFIGVLENGTWYVRRHIQELPTEPDAVIERADGHKYITATVDGETYRAREAMLSGERWHAVWRRDSGRGAISFVRSHEITPGTWKVDGE